MREQSDTPLYRTLSPNLFSQRQRHISQNSPSLLQEVQFSVTKLTHGDEEGCLCGPLRRGGNKRRHGTRRS